MRERGAEPILSIDAVKERVNQQALPYSSKSYSMIDHLGGRILVT